MRNFLWRKKKVVIDVRAAEEKRKKRTNSAVACVFGICVGCLALFLLSIIEEHFRFVTGDALRVSLLVVISVAVWRFVKSILDYIGIRRSIYKNRVLISSAIGLFCATLWWGFLIIPFVLPPLNNDYLVALAAFVFTAMAGFMWWCWYAVLDWLFS